MPCKIYEDTEEQINAYRLADNKVGELTTWENKTLEMELSKLDGVEVAGFNIDETEFTPFDTSFSDVNIDDEEGQVGYNANDLTNLVPITFYFEVEDRKEVMDKLENLRDEKSLQTKNNALLYLVRKK